MTTSLDDPVHDFDVNARGTLNVLEAVRAQDTAAARPLHLHQQGLRRHGDVAARRLRGQRYEPCDAALRARGFGEDRPLDFHSPYGCSKGAADQYVLDYARSYGLPPRSSA